jgi:streptogramin lyase
MLRVGEFEGKEITSGEGTAAVDGEGDLWFIDQSGVIKRVTPSGSLTSVFPPVFHKSTDVAAGPDGSIWVSASGDMPRGEGSGRPLLHYEAGIPAVEVRPRTTAVVRGGRLSVPLGCSGSARGCAGTVALRVASDQKKMAEVRYTVAGGTEGAASLVLPRSAREKLTLAGYLRLEVSASADGGIGGAGEIAIRTARPPRPLPGRPVVIPLPEGAGTSGISPGPGRDLWLGSGVGQFTLVSPEGQVSSVEVPGLAATPIATTSDSHHDLWFLESADRGFFSGDTLQPVVGRLDAAGKLSRFHLPPGPEVREGIAITRDGAAWVSRFDYGQGRGEIDRIGPGGKVRRYRIHAKELWSGVVAGRDGGVWFSEAEGRIVHLAVDGRRRSFVVPQRGDVEQLAVAADGDVWFTHARPLLPSALGRLTPAGHVTEYDVPGGGQFESLVLARDGDLWFSIGYPDRIGRMTPSGGLTTWRRGGAATGFSVVGREGDIWFAGTEQRTLAMAPFLILAPVIALFFICLAPTEFFGSFTAASSRRRGR